MIAYQWFTSINDAVSISQKLRIYYLFCNLKFLSRHVQKSFHRLKVPFVQFLSYWYDLLYEWSNDFKILKFFTMARTRSYAKNISERHWTLANLYVVTLNDNPRVTRTCHSNMKKSRYRQWLKYKLISHWFKNYWL